MGRRRALAAFVVVATVATAWVLLGGRGAERAERADVPPAPGPALPKLDASEKPKPDRPGAKASEAASPGPEAAATSRIAVRVIDADGGSGAGATVEAYPGGLGFPFDDAPTATTTAALDGSASLQAAPGAYWLRAFRGTAASMPAPVVAGRPEAMLVLEPARPLRGLVLLPEGAPARGFRVSLVFFHADRLASFSGSTDERGAFEMPAAPDAWLDRLVAEVGAPEGKSPGLGTEPGFRWEFELGREQLLGGTITLHLSLVRLRARVVDEAGTPVARAMIRWAARGAPDPPSFRLVAESDADGRFDAAVQRAAGEAFVIVAPGHAPLVWRPEASMADGTTDLPEIVLRRGVPLLGRVTDPAGRAIHGAAVRLESPRLPGQIIDQGMTDEGGRFRFEAIAEEEHVLYAFRRVDSDLCLPQLRMAGVRGGPDEVRVVLPEPICGTVRFVAQGTGDTVTVEHVTLIVKDARGAEVAKRTWEPGWTADAVRFEVWEEGTYDLEVYTARQEPARVSGVNVARGHDPRISVPLVPRR